MRSVSLLVLAAFLSACAQSPLAAVQQQDSVRLFESIAAPVGYASQEIASDDAIADLARSECQQDLPETFTRVVARGRGAQLVLYTDGSGETVHCSLLKLDDERVRQAEGEGVFSVNGAVFSEEDVAAAMDPDVSRELAIQTLINDALLRQEASGMGVSEEEVTATGIEDTAQAEEQARLGKLLRERLLADEIDVSEENVREYYVRNANQFLQSEQAVMRHIFVSRGGRSPEEFESRAQEVASRLRSEDFCALVDEYSDDRERQCGVYVVPRGVLDPNLEFASFSTPANETAVVDTAQGVHFVQTLQVTPPQVVPYEQIASELQSLIANTIFQERLSLYLRVLRADADIVFYK